MKDDGSNHKQWDDEEGDVITMMNILEQVAIRAGGSHTATITKYITKLGRRYTTEFQVCS